jgi:anthranilate 1,2-dioxygenase large subunit
MIVSDDTSLGITWPEKYSEVPKEIFHRDDVYELELERIFYGPTWHPIAHVAEMPNPGDYKTTQIGEAPVLVVHGNDGQHRVFYNACAHRGTQLQTCARGTGAKIECPYHRWTYTNEGALIGVPGVEAFPETFRKEDYGLKALRSEVFAGLIFATCSAQSPPLAEYLGETKDYFPKAMGGGGPLKLMGYQKVVFNTNWKVYRDNDGYHAPLLHRAFRLLGWQGGKGIQGMTRYAHKYYESELKAATNAEFLNDPSVIATLDTRGPLTLDCKAPRCHQPALCVSALERHHRSALRVLLAPRRRRSPVPTPHTPGVEPAGAERLRLARRRCGLQPRAARLQNTRKHRVPKGR